MNYSVVGENVLVSKSDYGTYVQVSKKEATKSLERLFQTFFDNVLVSGDSVMDFELKINVKDSSIKMLDADGRNVNDNVEAEI